MLSCRLGGPARNFCEAAKDTSSQKRFQAFRIESEAGISLALTEENLRRKETVLSVQTIKIITVGGCNHVIPKRKVQRRFVWFRGSLSFR